METRMVGNDTKIENGGGPLLSVNGSHARLEGRFEIKDSVHVQCEIGGEMFVEGELVIGKPGVVRADVKTVDAVIEGVYEGDMVATGSVEIKATGRVTGNLQTDALVIAPGGFFNGNVKRLEPVDAADTSDEAATAPARATPVNRIASVAEELDSDESNDRNGASPEPAKKD